MLEVKDLHVRVEGKEILKGVSLKIPKGETHVMFGPNGSGKTTLMLAIAGFPGYDVTSGRILLDKKDITNLEINERAKLGLGIAFQNPPEIRGIKLGGMLKICSGKNPKDGFNESEMNLIRRFNLADFLDRDVNLGFSGGERKRAELLQLMFQKPKLLLLDEPDSGVDIESLKRIGKEIQSYVAKTRNSAFVITHQGYILDYLNAKRACVMVDGQIHCSGRPKSILEKIVKSGYRKCVKCRKFEKP